MLNSNTQLMLFNSFMRNAYIHTYIHTYSYDNGSFYPGLPIADPHYVGKGKGKGYSVNVGWNGPGVGDKEYVCIYVFCFPPQISSIFLRYCLTHVLIDISLHLHKC